MSQDNRQLTTYNIGNKGEKSMDWLDAEDSSWNIHFHLYFLKRNPE